MREKRSLFFPTLLIAVGAMWLLFNLQIIDVSNLWALTYLLPYLLIAAGAGMILRILWQPAGMIVSMLTVIGAVLAVVYAPQLGWTRPAAWGADFSFGGGVKGSGEVKAETRPVQPFRQISIKYPAEVLVRQDDFQSVVVEAEDNLLPQLSTDVQAGALVIQNNNRNWAQRVNPTRPVKITITVTDLRSVDLSSAGKLAIEGVQTEELDVSLSGAGEMTLTKLAVQKLGSRLSGAGSIRADGAAEKVDITISGLGSFYGSELSSTEANVHISGAGNVAVRAIKTLNAVVSGAGSVSYYGSPQVYQRISGAGSVKQLGP